MYQASPDHKKRSTFQARVHRFIDAVASFFGSVPFLYIFTLVVIAWIAVNSLVFLPAWMHFDVWPYPFFTLALSLLAIYLSGFILISQNRQGELDRLREQAERERQQKQLEEEIELNKKEDAQEVEILQVLKKQNETLAKQNETLADVIALLNKAQIKPVRAARKTESEHEAS